MQATRGGITSSATDLIGFLECVHLANLEHEDRFRCQLAAGGLSVVEIESDHELPPAGRIVHGRDATLAAMRAGADVVYQAVLFDGRRLGYADFLRRVEQPSQLGDWSYEVWDTKLARQAKASAVIQLSMYSDMLAAMQGRAPEWMHLALGGVARETVSFRVSDYAAFYRSVAAEFETTVIANGVPFPVPTLPEPVEHCGVCRWALECRAQWRATDDLSLVAGLTSRQRRDLHAVGVSTRTALAEPPTPLPDRIEGVGRDSLARVQAQAAIQVRGERQGSIISERIPHPRDLEGGLVPSHGLLMLPEPSPGDLFFDIEGDPFFGSDEVDGIDYLFGVIEPSDREPEGQPRFHAFWGIDGETVTPNGERRAFEEFIDLVMDRLRQDPDLHIYHYAPYETTAVKRLAGRHGTREEEVDELLRGGVFVDLYRAIWQGIRGSVESYSIKRLEPLYGYEREIDLRDAGDSIVEFETWLELGEGDQRDAVLEEIEGYNRDDCVSTLNPPILALLSKCGRPSRSRAHCRTPKHV